MKISFTFDAEALRRERYLRLCMGTDRYSIPQDPVFEPVHAFTTKYSKGYPFIMRDLLHAAAVKMLLWPSTTSREQTLFAAGGLYLTLDQSHPDLAIRTTFGDFTSGFSHQFGVALSVISMSEAFGIPWDELTPIPVRGKRTLDYVARIPGNRGWLQLEAKGVTSKNSWYSARSNAYRKKLQNPDSLKSAKRTFSMPTAMIGVIAVAARSSAERGVIEIIDPDIESEPAARLPDNQIAGRYLHYAAVARFAGLHHVAAEFAQRADALLQGQQQFRAHSIHFAEEAIFSLFDREIVGVQWKLSDFADAEDDVWLYHGVDTERISAIVAYHEFPSTEAYHRHEFPVVGDQSVEGLLPDGSYFGMGIGSRDGLLRIDQRETDLETLDIARLD